MVLDRRRDYLRAGADQRRTIRAKYRRLYRLVKWLRAHPEASHDEVRSAGCRIAAQEPRDLGLLVLSGQAGAQALLDAKYSKGSPFLP